MFSFTLRGMMIIGALAIFSVVIILYFRNHIKHQANISRRIGYIYFIMGDVFLISSVFLFLLIKNEIDKQFFLFTSIAEGISEPFRLLMTALFVIGLVFTTIGVFYLFYSARIIPKEKITRET